MAKLYRDIRDQQKRMRNTYLRAGYWFVLLEQYFIVKYYSKRKYSDEKKREYFLQKLN